MAVLPLLNVTKCCFCFLLNIQEHCSMPECIPPPPEWNPCGQALASAARRRGSEIEVGEHWLRGTLSQQWKQSKVRGGSECHVPPGRSPSNIFNIVHWKALTLKIWKGWGQNILLFMMTFSPHQIGMCDIENFSMSIIAWLNITVITIIVSVYACAMSPNKQ